ncbi:MAG: 6-phosphofructokinase [Saprospiraceae bacterium]|nr:6-phosphofructokinase [Saprospiraceae bacterium]
MSKQINRIGVFCSGGDAPGMNAAVRAVVRTAAYHDLHTYGIYSGYEGMIDGNVHRLETNDVGNIIHRGGTILKTARSERFRTKEGRKMAHDTLMAHDIDALIAIGGNGTLTGANLFEKEFNIPIIGLPGTIDNDLYGTDYTIGFDTAVNTAIEAVDKIRDTADSHNRLFFIEVMGRHSGYIALYTAVGSGAGSVLIPELSQDVESLMVFLKKMLKRKRLFGLVITAEGNENGSTQEVAAIVAKRLTDYEVKVAVIGHLQRGGSPTAMDRMLASRTGHAAVEGLIKGHSNVMCGVHDNQVVFVPMVDAVKKSKSIEKELLNLAELLSL